MKNINRIIFSLFVVYALCLFVGADIALAEGEGKRMKMKKGPFVLRVKDELGLSESQVEDIRSTFQAARESCKESGSFSKRRECMRGKREGLKAQVKSLLSEKQYEELVSLRKEKRGERKQRRRGRGGERGGDRS